VSDADPVPLSVPLAPAAREQFWREAITAFPASGLSVRAYCLRHGLHEKRFYTWRRNLGLSPVSRPDPSASHDPITAFVPVRVVSDPTAEVVLPGGVTLRVPLSAEPTHVARLVAALRGGAC
jgi:hypothetical protein